MIQLRMAISGWYNGSAWIIRVKWWLIMADNRQILSNVCSHWLRLCGLDLCWWEWGNFLWIIISWLALESDLYQIQLVGCESDLTCVNLILVGWGFSHMICISHHLVVQTWAPEPCSTCWWSIVNGWRRAHLSSNPVRGTWMIPLRVTGWDHPGDCK